MSTAADFEIVIKARTGWQPVNFSEIWRYRELSGFLVWRDIKIRYKQTALGSLWAVLQPLVATVVLGVGLQRVVNLQGDGSSPYLLFVYAGLVPWTFFANAVSLASNSLIGNEQLISKVYFPRVLIPLGAIGALALDMVIGLGFMAFMMLYYHWHVTASLLWLPVFIVGGFMAAAGLGLTLSALNVHYRDIKYLVAFCMQMMFFLTPVLYPLSHVPGRLHFLLSLNPMAGIVEGFRHALLGSPVSWLLVGGALGLSAVAFICGVFFFGRMERTFADVI